MSFVLQWYASDLPLGISLLIIDLRFTDRNIRGVITITHQISSLPSLFARRGNARKRMMKTKMSHVQLSAGICAFQTCRIAATSQPGRTDEKHAPFPHSSPAPPYPSQHITATTLLSTRCMRSILPLFLHICNRRASDACLAYSSPGYVRFSVA